MDNKPYIPREIEPKIQEFWEKLGLYRAAESKENNFYCLDMFPYPSGDGLHVGHVEGYTATDIYSRYKRMRGFNVLHPMGWDAFGLPAENTAIKQKTHPSKLVAKNVARFKQQLQKMGFSYDWSREINTTDPEYYKWTQWIFVKLFKMGLAYEAVVPINWCPSCKTGLANEEVVDGKCERCGTSVEKKNLRQWMLKITKYSDRLLKDLDQLDWPEGIKELQRNWIGRKTGINIDYPVEGTSETLVCFTTRPDTNFGSTFIVLAPEHPFVQQIINDEIKPEDGSLVVGIKDYVQKALSKSEVERQEEGRTKTGVFTGFYANNRLNEKMLPIWISDFVLGGFGTGAVVGVPGHDRRDFEFAKKFNLPVIRVVVASDGDESLIERIEQVQENEGKMINSSFLDGMDIHEATEKIMDYLEGKKWGTRVINYKLRDWVFSRQRYWGEPIPVVHCEKCGVVAVPEEQLPVKLPDVENYEPTGTGESPLAQISEWVNTKCPQCGGPAKRETNTMPQWAGSCWYFLRFINPQNQNEPWNWEQVENWMPVGLYVGGAEHAVLHLLYSRFWIKALYDAGFLPLQEPFKSLRNQGSILGPDNQKMSKSKGNVINPDDIVAKYGADTLRLYEMFLGPFEASKPWDDRAIAGVSRFLYRIWGLINKISDQIEESVVRELNKLIKKVGEDVESMKFNTAISFMMEFVNLCDKKGIDQESFKKFLIILSPFAPHISEELWQKFQPEAFVASVTQETWPAFDPNLIVEKEINLVVQVNGKVRDTIKVSIDMSEDELTQLATASEKVKPWLENKKIIKTIIVKNKLISFVVG